MIRRHEFFYTASAAAQDVWMRFLPVDRPDDGQSVEHGSDSHVGRASQPASVIVSSVATAALSAPGYEVVLPDALDRAAVASARNSVVSVPAALGWPQHDEAPKPFTNGEFDRTHH
jgi:hypothetical protein